MRLASLILAELRRPKGSPNVAPYLSRERKGNPRVDFPMVIMASSIARGRAYARRLQNRRAEGKPDHEVTKLESEFYLFLD